MDNFFSKDKDGNTVKPEYCGTNKEVIFQTCKFLEKYLDLDEDKTS